MSSNINPNVNVNYPVAGEDNDSKGFRDNFTSIRDSLVIAKQEISNLQANAVLKAKLATPSSPVVNDLLGSTLHNGMYSQLNGVVHIGNLTSADTNSISLQDGPAQSVVITANTNIEFTDWLTGYSCMRLLMRRKDETVTNVKFRTTNSGQMHFGSANPSDAFFGGDTIASITINDAGSGMVNPATVTIDPPTNGGVPAVATATYTAVSVNIVAGGTGYVVGDMLHDNSKINTVFKVASIGGNGAIVTVDSLVSAIYAAPTDATVKHATTLMTSTSGTGTGSGAMITIGHGVRSVNLTNRGTGYTTTPSVTVTSTGATTQATATAVLTTNGDLSAIDLTKTLLFDIWSIDAGANVFMRYIGAN